MRFLSSLFVVFLNIFNPIPLSSNNDFDFEDLFENHQTVMLIVNPETGMIYYSNQAAAAFYGYSKETLMSMSIMEINILTYEQIISEMEKATQEERNFFVFRHQLASGDIKTVHVYSYPIIIEQDEYLFSIIIDQTAYVALSARNRTINALILFLLTILVIGFTYLSIKFWFKKRSIEQANRLINEQERVKSILIANLPGVAYRCKDDNNWSMLYISEKIAEITGYTQDDFYTNRIQYQDLIDPTYSSVVRDAFKQGAKSLQQVNLSYPIITKDKKIKWVEEYARYINQKTEDGLEIIEGFIQDITDKKVADTNALHYKNLLQHIISKSNQGIAVHDNDLNYVYVSKAYREMYRIQDRDIIGKHHYEVFPDLPQKWRDIHQRCLKGEVLRGDRDLFERADGSLDYTRWMCRPWYDEDNQIGGIIIYTEVINDLIKAEIQLKESRDQLQLVMEKLPIGIAVNSVDPEVNFVYMNDRFPEFYRTTKENLKKSDSFWEAVYEDEIFREEIKKRVIGDITSGDVKRMIWENIPITRKNEPTKYITAYGTPVPGSNLVISTVVDVTDRKEKEDKILYASNHDYLTGLPNRRYFEDKIIEIDKEESYPLGVLMMDFDGLKLINDAYGHESGNLALKKITAVLSESKRANDFLARIGGDEFVILCPNTNHEEAKNLKHIILDKIAKITMDDIVFSLSIGVMVKTDEKIDFSVIFKEAENDMYAKKVIHGQSARNEAVMTIFQALKEKYQDERTHSDKVSEYCRLIGEKLNLRRDEIKELELAGLMHDIGKITIPDNILGKPGSLNAKEWNTMQKHTINGYQILRSADKYSRLAEYALSHHERVDGNGYPNGLKGEEIPLFARIISIADAYEVMTSDRPYRKAMDKEKAMSILQENAGTQFDEYLVSVFLKEIIEL